MAKSSFCRKWLWCCNRQRGRCRSLSLCARRIHAFALPAGADFDKCIALQKTELRPAEMGSDWPLGDRTLRARVAEEFRGVDCPGVNRQGKSKAEDDHFRLCRSGIERDPGCGQSRA